MPDVERKNAVPQHDTLAAEPLPEPLPVDEAGLETDEDIDRYAVDDTAPVTPDPAPAAPDLRREHDAALFTDDAATRLRTRWRELQADFVDDPQRAVREADDVVDEVLRTITEHRQRLAGDWQGHTDTEDLRLAMREYRSFFDQLMPMT